MADDNLLAYLNISQLLTMEGVAKKKGRHTQEADLGIISNAAVVADSDTGKIVWVGETTGLPNEYRNLRNVQNCEGYMWLPELVECHTHLIFGGNRYKDFGRRCAGMSYQQVAAAGGGIQSTLEATRSASIDELQQRAEQQLDRFQRFGVGTVEVKSGYGLTLEHELKMLECVERLRSRTSVRLLSTFMPAHMTPPEFKGRTDEYVEVICKEWIPEVAKKEWATFFDVFVEDGYFSVDQARLLCETAKNFGFRIKLHAEQFNDLGGTDLAVELGAVSADHLDQISDPSIRKIANSDTVAVLLPGASLFAGTSFPPARKLIDEGARVALSTDFNPGTSPTRNLPLMTTLACCQMGMTVAEALAGVTYNAAAALGVEGRIGTLEVGKEFRAFQIRGDSYESLTYCFGELG